MSEKRIVMIVDDDLDDRDFFCDALTDVDASAECLKASDGADALQLLRNGVVPIPDFIFLDLNMPRMDGRRCLMEIKKDEKLKDIPVIIYSTSRQQTDKDELRQLGSVHFITKPSEFKLLRNEILFVMNTKWDTQPMKTLV